MAAGLSAMEAEFREIDESGSWNAIYQVGPRRQFKVEMDREGKSPR